MRVLRGRDPRPAVDREHTAALLADASDGTPEFGCGRRPVRSPSDAAMHESRDSASEAACRRARVRADRTRRGGEPSVRGRHARVRARVAHPLPLVDGRGFESIPDRYERAIETVIRALRSLGAEVSTGEPPESFCPGDHSIRVAGGGKVAGIAQRVRGTPRSWRAVWSSRGRTRVRRRCHRGGVRRARRSIRPRDGRGASRRRTVPRIRNQSLGRWKTRLSTGRGATANRRSTGSTAAAEQRSVLATRFAGGLRTDGGWIPGGSRFRRAFYSRESQFAHGRIQSRHRRPQHR